jgi:AhpD family alkylhydroperoxidase
VASTRRTAKLSAMANPGRSRLHLRSSFAAGHDAMRALDAAVAATGLDNRLIELVRLRASQLNGCAYCVDMHSQDARMAGEQQQRLDTLVCWRETPFFDDRERAALELTESLTLVAGRGISDADIAAARAHFEEDELVRLIYVITAINAWNRLSIAAASPVGVYRAAPAGG